MKGLLDFLSLITLPLSWFANQPTGCSCSSFMHALNASTARLNLETSVDRVLVV